MLQKLKKAVSAALAAAVIFTLPGVNAFAGQSTKNADTFKSKEAEVYAANSGSSIDVNTGAAITVKNTKISAKQKNRSVVITLKNSGKGKISGYEIYKKTKPGPKGKWKKVKEIKSTGKASYTDRKVSYKKTYAYKARAYFTGTVNGVKIKHKTGKFSDIVKKKVSLSVADATIKARAVKTSVRLTVSHKKSGRITGYQIYKKNTSGKWVAYKKIHKSGTAVFTDKKPYSRRKNVYAVKAYFKSQGKTYYGHLSKHAGVKLSVTAVTKKVTDRNSALYGKTLVLYQYADGKMVSNPTKYVDEDSFSEYELYVNKSKQYVTAYGKKDGKLYPLRAFICSPGHATPVGTHHIIRQLRWHTLMGPCWGQWCSQVASNGIYFHSIFSSQPNSNNTMSVRGYNNLGITCSHGCIRLQAGSAKWIFDHCKVGTKVVIDTASGYEPFKKPVIGKLPYWHTWDPTDPTAQKYCKAHKCHRFS